MENRFGVILESCEEYISFTIYMIQFDQESGRMGKHVLLRLSFNAKNFNWKMFIN